ncbi:MAG: 50S ribosomal protein L15 [Candidatus Verstraetearchaeota archaeon]|jgi:large subunit ribosomal protein L15|nr:50S ribosomal protein L15 [Candidatus Methanomethylicia archaeon]NHV45091.1 50S ribosomal protein L15 [Candidatus Verstraetearchaeota archaeon]
MVVRREKKVRRQRGSRTYGWGTVGQHRKAGMRGGFGNAGLHKHKWSWTVKYGKDHFGKYGFVNPTSRIKRWINVGSLISLIKGKELEKDEKGRIIIDLNKMGYDKLLGSGKIDIPILVKVKQASEIAKEKIISKGGEVIIG